MSVISEKINVLYKQYENDEKNVISDEYVELSTAVLRRFRIKSLEDLFFFLSAANLQNAAIKQKEHKKKLSYSFFKRKVLVIVENVITHMHDESLAYYYNVGEKCLYISLFGIVFSFHNVEEDLFMQKISIENEPIVWPGIRLQKIASEVFEIGMSLPNSKKFLSSICE